MTAAVVGEVTPKSQTNNTRTNYSSIRKGLLPVKHRRQALKFCLYASVMAPGNIFSRHQAGYGETENDMLFKPGGENNMNAVDDGRLTKSLRLRVVMPMHWDRFRV